MGLLKALNFPKSLIKTTPALTFSLSVSWLCEPLAGRDLKCPAVYVMGRAGVWQHLEILRLSRLGRGGVRLGCPYPLGRGRASQRAAWSGGRSAEAEPDQLPGGKAAGCRRRAWGERVHMCVDATLQRQDR